MDKFLTLNYYFEMRPLGEFEMTKVVFGIGALLILFGFWAEWYRKKSKDKVLRKSLKKYTTIPVWYGAFVLLLLLIREVNLPFLSMRFWWIVLGLFMIRSLVKFLKNHKKEYAQKSKLMKQSKKTDKYLPKKKKRK